MLLERFPLQVYVQRVLGGYIALQVSAVNNPYLVHSVGSKEILKPLNSSDEC